MDSITTIRNRIPRVIIQTGKCLNDKPRVNRWQLANPSYAYKYFDDEMCKLFLAEHFEDRVVKAFKTLRPGAFKADLFRYAYLFVHGGVYIDLDCVPWCNVTLDHILSTGTDMVSVSERRRIPGIYQAFLACKPRVPQLKAAVDKICDHVEKLWYPDIPRNADIWPYVLSITGPVLLSNAFDGVHQCGYQEVKGTSLYLYRLKSNRAAHVLDFNDNIMMISHLFTGDYVTQTRQPYEKLVQRRKIYGE